MLSIEQVKHSLQGPIASVSTPFNRDGSIDYISLRSIVDFIIEAGSGTVLLTFGDSLFSLLTDDEIAAVTKVVVEHTKKRALVVTAGRWWLGKSIKFAQYAKQLGVDVFMALPPDWVESCTTKTLEEYYCEIGREIPLMLVTALGTRPLPLDVVERLLEKDTGIVAFKDDIAGVYAKRAARLINGRWAFLSGGRKQNHLDVMPYGADGYLSVYMRFKPEVARDYWKAMEKCDIKKAADIINLYDVPFMEELPGKLGINFDAIIHGAMEIYGIAGRWRRVPYNSANDEQMEKIRGFFKERSLI